MVTVPETGAITHKAFIDITCSHSSKKIANPWWFMHVHFGQLPPETGAPYLTPRRHTMGTLQSSISINRRFRLWHPIRHVKVSNFLLWIFPCHVTYDFWKLSNSTEPPWIWKCRRRVRRICQQCWWRA